MRGAAARRRSPRKVEEALALVRLRAQAAKLPGQLSGGQQQRVAIARAIVIEPPLVLMDEPLSNLDAKLRLEMRAEIRRIHDALGSTTIYVTHDQDEALSLADRIVVLRDGAGAPGRHAARSSMRARPMPTSPSSWASATSWPARVDAADGGYARASIGPARAEGRRRSSRSRPATAVVAIRPEDLVAERRTAPSRRRSRPPNIAAAASSARRARRMGWNCSSAPMQGRAGELSAPPSRRRCWSTQGRHEWRERRALDSVFLRRQRMASGT